MNKWYANLKQREQLSLLLLGLALGIYLLYIAVWSPLSSARDEIFRQNQSVASSLVRVDSMVSEILLLRESGAGERSKKNLTALINQSTSRSNLKVSRLQPNSRGEVQVRLESVSFDDLLAWLYEMEHNQGLFVREVSITRSGSSGRVNASVRLAQGG
jgi:general secretion pathway protein M